MRWTLRLSGAALAATILFASPGAMATKIGVGGVVAAGELGTDAVVGLQGGLYFGVPAVKRLNIGGDVTYYFADQFTMITVEPNVHFDLVQTPVLDLYALGGVNVLYRRVDVIGFTDSDVDVGLLLGAGAEVKAGPLHPFADLKVALHGDPYVAGSVGLRLAF